MTFPFGETVYRDRPPQVTDPYNPDRTRAGSFDDDDAETITLQRAFVASSSSSAVSDATRGQVLSTKSLYCRADADVKIGDRIRTAAGVWYVNELPAADTNPFTGRQPVREVPLDGALG